MSRVGAVKRSDLLGGPLCELVNSENEDNEEKVSASDILGGQKCVDSSIVTTKTTKGK